MKGREEMAFCVECGKELKDDEKFCPSCGTKTDEPVAEESTPITSVTVTSTTPTTSGGNNDIAIAGFICALLGLNIVGLILSGIGLANASKCGDKNKGLALAGVIISCIRLVLTIIIIIIYFYALMYV